MAIFIRSFVQKWVTGCVRLSALSGYYLVSQSTIVVSKSADIVIEYIIFWQYSVVWSSSCIWLGELDSTIYHSCSIYHKYTAVPFEVYYRLYYENSYTLRGTKFIKNCTNSQKKLCRIVYNKFHNANCSHAHSTLAYASCRLHVRLEYGNSWRIANFGLFHRTQQRPVRAKLKILLTYWFGVNPIRSTAVQRYSRMKRTCCETNLTHCNVTVSYSYSVKFS